MDTSVVFYGIGLGQSTALLLADAIVAKLVGESWANLTLHFGSVRSIRNICPDDVATGIRNISGRKLCVFAHRHDSVGTRPKMLCFYQTLELEFREDPDVEIVILHPIPEPTKRNHIRRCAEVKLACH
jgi:hypothetical protein